MKALTIFLMVLMLAACGKGKSNSSSSNGGISSNYLSPSTVDGYLLANGQLIINNTPYQMASSLTSAQLNQQLASSGVRPIQMNGVSAYHARITGGLYNQCAQYNQSCVGAVQSNVFYVTAVQFIQ